MEVQAHFPQILLNGTGRDTRINEYSPLTRTQVVTVTATTARKASKYKPVFFHFTKSGTKVLKIFDICKYKRKKSAKNDAFLLCKGFFILLGSRS
jgi:hypothetical protein